MNTKTQGKHDDKDRDWSNAATSQATLKFAKKLSEVRVARKDFPRCFRGRMDLDTSWIRDKGHYYSTAASMSSMLESIHLAPNPGAHAETEQSKTQTRKQWIFVTAEEFHLRKPSTL